MPTCKRLKLDITGIVQGVGFRPFVYQLAHQYQLKGFVLNNGTGVVIEIEGDNTSIETFIKQLKLTAPPLSRIDSLEQHELKFLGSNDFIIRKSNKGNSSTMVSPDIALCEDCLSEMQDPSNRRYNYPFINCTNCGPRYSIIDALPYDRPHTSMVNFKMCLACQAEYDDPANRRFHAQPISCYDCGPKLSLLDNSGKVIATEDTCLEEICHMIKAGKTVALKGLGGFHLVCDATNEKAILRLRNSKRRPSKPLAVMFPDMISIRSCALLSQEDEALILSQERPIVIVSKKESSIIADLVAVNINKIAVFLPYTPLHVRLLDLLNRPIVATSANLSGEPIIIDETKLFKKLAHVVSAVLTHDRAIINACDDSVVMMADKEKVTLRMARGMSPKSFLLSRKTKKKILALGGHQKSTIALAFDNHMILSPHIGDLGSLESLEYLDRTIETFKRFYNFEPDLIVHDKHPEYDTSKWAKERSLPRLELQHHYAHALACMAEHHLDEDVLAFCFDGTGMGDDKSLWGGEVLIANPLEYQRISHLRTFRLLGGEKAIKEPRRLALALLFECFSLEEVLSFQIPTIESFTKEEIHTLHQMWEKQINAPLTSSMGRLFDAIASLSGLTQTLSYEGESGLAIETAAKHFQTSEHFNNLLADDTIDWEPMIRELLVINPQHIPTLFINMIVELIIATSQKYPHLHVLLSGGVFQNQLLVSLLTQKFKALDITYYLQNDTPINDGGIALGQLYHALKKEENES